MPSAPAVSCIVPVFNGERYLRQALKSILRQTCPPREILVVDDGSTDRSAEIAGEFPGAVTCISQENRGVAAARNRGLEAARGEFIAFLDADDLWHTGKLDRQLACFRDRPQLQYCITHIRNFWIPELRHRREQLKDHRFSGDIPGFVCQTLLARREVFERVGTFNESLRGSEDSDWFSRVRESGAELHVIPEVLAFRRMHHTNLSYRMYSEGREDMLKTVMLKLKRNAAV